MDPNLNELIAIIRSRTSTVEERHTAGLALAKHPKEAVPLLLAAMDPRDYWPWRDYFYTFPLFDPPPIPELLQALHSKRWSVRRNAATMLGQCLCRTREVAMALAQALLDPIYAVREAARATLSGYGPLPLEVLPMLIADLSGDLLHNYYYGVNALTLMGPEGLPELCTYLRHPSETVRRVVLIAVGRIDQQGTAVTELTACLNDESQGIRRDAVRILGLLGPSARPALPTLIAATRDQSGTLRRRALNALLRIGELPPEAVPALIERLHDPIPNIRRRAVDALGSMGPRASVARMSLAACLWDPNMVVVAATFKSLVRMGLDAATIAVLREFANRAPRNLRERVLAVIAQHESEPLPEPS